MIVVIGVFGCTLIGAICWWYYQFFKHEPFFSKYNGPRPIPIFGNIYRIFSNKDIIPVLMKYLEKHGPVIRMWFGFHPRIIIADYRTAAVLLDSTAILDKSYDYKFFEPWLGTGLLTSTGAKWRKHRKLLTPTFHFQILEQYISIFGKESDVLIERLSKAASSEPIDIYKFINLCALDIMYESVMGLQIRAQAEHNSVYIRNVAEMTKIVLGRIFSTLKSYDFLYKLTHEYRKQLQLLEELHAHTNFVISCREKRLEDINNNPNGREESCETKKRKAFLDLLLESKATGAAQLTRENIREEVDTFLFEGHDTTSSAISFTLYCLSKHADIQKKVVEELHGIFNNHDDRTLSYNKVREMKYLEMVVKETLRLYPPVVLYARELAEDTEFDGVTIPKGTNLTMFLYGLHRQKEVFPDPEKFDPERFTLENVARRSPFAYVPFSAGVRNCIGQRFAMNIVKSVVAKVLLHFEVLPVEGYKPDLEVDAVLKSKNGVLVNLRKRRS